MSLPTADTLAELVRLPAVLSVPGDAWTGAASTGNRRGWAMPAASALIYLGGMALNDWADRELDAEERPERPIPSGRISPTAALAVGAGMVAGGVGVAGAIGGRAGLRIAVPLAASVWAYDVMAKDTPAGPAIMALCRALDVLLGAAGGDITRALPAAALVGTHTLTVTTVSQHEVHGASVGVPLTALRRTAATALGLLALGLPAREEEGRGAAGLRRLATAGAAASYLAIVGGGYKAAVAADGDAGAVRQSVGTGVMGVIPLQSGLLASTGSWLRAAITASAVPVGRHLRRKRAVT
ncbi:SCO3242 family prenyltransferase [Euzebya pacifica]|uniref:SCO3242 family prenyltransferase n=1 Tax=Euzebya pacifica TaxID=1608957 RepID=UPI0030F6A394